ncbi:adenylate cyclase [Rhodoferax koreense]|uniref:Adenylate cyclase n=1 Tax=Rhodoferax koreensis TaxID=1842727 RepID=A0A1P8JVK5_9BURK|nr:class IV adenylate cyclase [Rhodoferax koreense]APW37768.1 adenylate cyclase [Rhodoferax koreense]
MSRNIEIKAAVSDAAALMAKAASLATSGPTMIAQDDTFFGCENGRLKLRAFADGSGELIFYRRANADGPKTSFYDLAPTPDADQLRHTLSLAYGVAGRVIKNRTLYLVGRTRVHIDHVQGLGDFMELEVVLREDEAEIAGIQEAHHLMTALGISRADLVDKAYVDLLPANPRAEKR